MDSVPGNVYFSDMSFFTDPNDAVYMSSQASTSTNPPWPIPALDLIPAHLVPATETLNGPSAYQVELSRMYGTEGVCDINNFYQSCHLDWTTEGTQDVWSANQLVAGGGLLLGTSDLHSSAIGQASLPAPDFTDLPPLPNDLFISDPWMASALVTEDYSPFDAVLPGFVGPEHEQSESAAWDIFDFTSGFDAQTFLPCHNEDLSSDAKLTCGWLDNGSLCNAPYPSGDMGCLKHAIAQHLQRAHNLGSSSGKLTLKCKWVGCSKELKLESFVRHVLTVHLRVATACKGCGTTFARSDSLQRHMRNSCGASKRER